MLIEKCPEKCNCDYSDSDEICIFCPNCKTISDGCEIDDYVGSNCLFWCHKCGEILICPTGYNDKHNKEIHNLKHDKIINSCSLRLNQEDIQSYIDEHGYEFDGDINKYNAYTVGILCVTLLSRHKFDDDSDSSDDDNPDEIDSRSWNVNVMRFSDLDKKVDKSHDGCFLYYRAHCSECLRNYQSCIWGD